MPDFIHNDPDFKELIVIVAADKGIDSALIEKDYWIMHTLYSLHQQGIEFELKGGTSLSKGFGLIHRFSEDIDLHIRTNFGLNIEGQEDKPKVREARKQFYDVLAASISVNGSTGIIRDHSFDDTDKYRSGGIRIFYNSHTPALSGLKDGILLEAGFDTVTPNIPITISSWIWDYLVSIHLQNNYTDNTAKGVRCYHPGYTLIEKLQTIIRKYRTKNLVGASSDLNLMRQYYDVYCLLGNPSILEFVGSPEYLIHKSKRIKGADNNIPLAEHPALLVEDEELKKSYERMYLATAKLYYNGQPALEEVLARIHKHLKIL
jgi:hypothetical protein